jgi:sugar/nucleoside kinase (ribokinase family)
MDVVLCGHICLDIIPRWSGGGIEMLIPGHVLEMTGVDVSTGGSVANTGLALFQLGIRPNLLGKIGNDAFGRIILETLQKQDVELSKNIIISDNDSSSYTIVLNSPDTDRIFLHYPGSNHTFSAREIPYSDIEGACLFHFGYPPLMKKFYEKDGQELIQMFAKVRKMKMITSLDMAMPDPETPSGKINWRKLLENVLPYIDIFVPSIDELLYMWNRKDYQQWINGEKSLSLDWLSQLSQDIMEYGTNIVMIKLGKIGLFLHTGKLVSKHLFSTIDLKKWSLRQLFSSCFNTKVIGTTGAGDATIAGFLSQIVQGSTPEQAINIGTATGAYCVEATDATSGIKSMIEIKERISKGWKKQLPLLSTKQWEWLPEYQLWERF